MNSRFFNLCRVYSNLLKMTSVGEFPWGWFLEDRTQVYIEKKKLGIFTSKSCKDGKEMNKKAWCTCKVVVLRDKPIAFLTSSLPSPSPSPLTLLKLPIENTLQSTFRSLQMHSTDSKRPYKLCICSVILGELESFRNYKGFCIIFPKILDAI